MNVCTCISELPPWEFSTGMNSRDFEISFAGKHSSIACQFLGPKKKRMFFVLPIDVCILRL